MVQYTNFYQTLKEAKMRLADTVVLYEGKPYYVLTITDHKPDGIYRMYLDDLTHPKGPAFKRFNIPLHHYSEEEDDEDCRTLGDVLDDWMECNKDTGVIRRMMNSPSFNKFRPFPLGMVNQAGSVIYVERQPTRNTYQGLSENMLNQTVLSVIPPESRGYQGRPVSVLSSELASTIVGDYPSRDEALKAMIDPAVSNEGVAFSREFALFRGPLSMLFLAYKSELVGVLPNHDYSKLRLGSGFSHLLEVCQESEIFDEVTVSQF